MTMRFSNSVQERTVEADLTADGSQPAGPMSGERGKGADPTNHTLFGNADHARGPGQLITLYS